MCRNLGIKATGAKDTNLIPRKRGMSGKTRSEWPGLDLSSTVVLTLARYLDDSRFTFRPCKMKILSHSKGYFVG